MYRLSQFDFDMEYQKGVTNPADGLSRRPDYMAEEIEYHDVVPALRDKLKLHDHEEVGFRPDYDKGELAYEDLLPTEERTLANVTQLPAAVLRQIAYLSRKEGGPSRTKAILQARRQCENAGQVCRVASVRRGQPRQRAKQTYRSRIANEAASPRAMPIVGTWSLNYVAAMTRAARKQAEAEPEEVNLGEVETSAILGDQQIPIAVSGDLVGAETAWTAKPSQKFYETIRELQKQDPACEILIQASKQKPGTKGGYHVDGQGALCFRVGYPQPGRNPVEIAVPAPWTTHAAGT